MSSKVQKYEAIYSHKVSKYGQCDTIVFAEVLGHKKAKKIISLVRQGRKLVFPDILAIEKALLK